LFFNVSKIAKNPTSKNKSFLILELCVVQLLFSQTCSTKFLHLLTKQTGGDGNQQVSNLEKSVSGAAATTLSSYSWDICGVIGGLKIMHKE
jgi:hypothetical protein